MIILRLVPFISYALLWLQSQPRLKQQQEHQQKPPRKRQIMFTVPNTQRTQYNWAANRFDTIPDSNQIISLTHIICHFKKRFSQLKVIYVSLINWKNSYVTIVIIEWRKQQKPQFYVWIDFSPSKHDDFDCDICSTQTNVFRRLYTVHASVFKSKYLWIVGTSTAIEQNSKLKSAFLWHCNESKEIH